MAKALSDEQVAAFKAGYNDRYDGRPIQSGTLTGRAARMYNSGYVQACNDFVIFKRDREDGLRRALGGRA